MSWQNRVRTEIRMTSPGGNIFTPKWIGDERSKEKKLGIFDYPNFDGSIVQDLGITGSRYPLTIYFDGEDNDLESQRFYTACDERGTWEIVHPVKGNLSLQLISVTEHIQPNTSGNVTTFDTSWIEPAAESIVKTDAQIKAEIDYQSQIVNGSAAGQYNSNISDATAADSIANKQTVQKSLVKADSFLSNLSAVSDDVSAEITSINRGIQDTLDQATIDKLSLAGQIQQAVQLPSLVANDLQARLSAYIALSDDIFTLSPTGAKISDKNIVSVVELVEASIFVSIANSITAADLTTRTEAVNLIDTLTDLFNTITENLDNVQDAFLLNSIDKQYFSNSQSYSDLLILLGLMIAYLLRNLLNLKIEKRFTLDRPRSPIEITVTEYGSLGVNDINLDFFIATNALYGNEIRLLPAGKEVAVYV